MATEKIRWPNNAAKARDDTEKIAKLIEQYGNEAIETIRSSPLESEIAIVHMMRLAAHIRLLMIEAKNGREPKG